MANLQVDCREWPWPGLAHASAAISSLGRNGRPTTCYSASAPMASNPSRHQGARLPGLASRDGGWGTTTGGDIRPQARGQILGAVPEPVHLQGQWMGMHTLDRSFGTPDQLAAVLLEADPWPSCGLGIWGTAPIISWIQGPRPQRRIFQRDTFSCRAEHGADQERQKEVGSKMCSCRWQGVPALS